MRKLVLSVAIASLIVVPSAFAHRSTSGHGRMHASSHHASHKSDQDGRVADRVAASEQASRAQSVRHLGRHADEEELAVDELASTKAN